MRVSNTLRRVGRAAGHARSSLRASSSRAPAATAPAHGSASASATRAVQSHCSSQHMVHAPGISVRLVCTAACGTGQAQLQSRTGLALGGTRKVPRHAVAPARHASAGHSTAGHSSNVMRGARGSQSARHFSVLVAYSVHNPAPCAHSSGQSRAGWHDGQRRHMSASAASGSGAGSGPGSVGASGAPAGAGSGTAGTPSWPTRPADDDMRAYFSTADDTDTDDASAWIDASPKTQFRLSSRFVERYCSVKAPFGFNGLGELVYQRTYSRLLEPEDGSPARKERWFETVERVVNGTYNMQKRWIEQHGLGWNPWRAQRSAQEMYDRIFHMKFLPPGRGLWAMGSPITEKRQLYAALNNCAFVSTERLKDGVARPFCFLMDASMLGVGVGFDTKGAGTVIVRGVNDKRPTTEFVVPDSREGWVDSVRVLLEVELEGKGDVVFDYSEIRPAGAPIKGFGGVCSGAASLEELHKSIRATLAPLRGEPITVTAIVDIMNLIGRCVVSGNVRQTAEIAFGDPLSEEYINLKDYDVNPHRADYGWTSNNSVFATLGMDYDAIVERIAKNGEPGFAWLENMRAFSRMKGEPDFKDRRAAGGNPCLEQTLESYELCCLVETFPNNHESFDDFRRTLKYAYLYAKTVTLGKTHWPVTNRVMLRNRRIGCSLSGIAQFVANKGLHNLQRWSEEGYDAIQHYDKLYSDWLAIPRSIKTTCVKPSGTVSLVAGSTPGIHYPESRCYIRRVRVSAHSELIKPLAEAGFDMEPAVEDPVNTVVVSFPVDVGEGVRTLPELSVWEQLSLAAFLQKHWADNQVSCTVTFDPETEREQLKPALELFQYQLKGVSFLPRMKSGAYKQMPYEAITLDQYQAMVNKLRPLDLNSVVSEDAVGDKYCESDKCNVLSVVDPTMQTETPPDAVVAAAAAAAAVADGTDGTAQ